MFCMNRHRYSSKSYYIFLFLKLKYLRKYREESIDGTVSYVANNVTHVAFILPVKRQMTGTYRVR